MSSPSSERVPAMTQQAEAYGLLDSVAMLWRRRGLFLSLFLLIALVSGAVVLSLPVTYQSQATILIEQEDIPTELVRTTVGGYADKRIQLITQRVMTSSNLIPIAERYDLYPEARAENAISEVVQNLKDSISIQMVSADVMDPGSGRTVAMSIAFIVSFDHESPVIAQRVTEHLVSLFLEENERQRAQSVDEASALLRVEVERHRQLLDDLQARLSSYKEAHADELPGMVDAHLRTMESLEGRLLETDRDLRSLRERRVLLETELAQVSQYAIGYAADGSPVLGAADRLKALQAEYVSKAARYAPTHPDVVRLQQEVMALQDEVGGGPDTTEVEAGLQAARAELVQARQRYSADHPTVRQLEQRIAALEADLAAALRRAGPAATSRPDNPAYIQIQSRLRGVEVEIRQFLESRSKLLEKIEAYADKIARAPGVERELSALEREYNNVSSRYRDLTTRQMDAELASTLERGNQGGRLSLIEPAPLPEKPIKPNRPALLLLGLLLSCGTSIAVVGIREHLDDTVRTTQDLTALLNRPPIGVIPYIREPDLGRLLRRRVGVGVAALAVLVLGGWWIASRVDLGAAPILGFGSLSSNLSTEVRTRADGPNSAAARGAPTMPVTATGQVGS